MHETLKIILNTLTLIILTTIVFFGLYFLAPSLSEDLFGISYRQNPENLITSFQSSFLSEESGIDLGSTVSSAASAASDMIANSSSTASSGETVEEVVVAEVVIEEVSTVDENGVDTAVLSDAGEAVYQFYLENSDRINQAVGSAITLSADNLNEVALYLQAHGEDIARVLSRGNLADYAIGEGSSSVSAILRLLGGSN